MVMQQMGAGLLGAVSGVPETAPALGTLGMVGAVGAAPPGTGQLATIISWVAFLSGVALIAAFMASMGKAGMSALRHGQFEGGSGAMLCLVAGVFLAAAGPIFAVLGISTS